MICFEREFGVYKLFVFISSNSLRYQSKTGSSRKIERLQENKVFPEKISIIKKYRAVQTSCSNELFCPFCPLFCVGSFGSMLSDFLLLLLIPIRIFVIIVGRRPNFLTNEFNRLRQSISQRFVCWRRTDVSRGRRITRRR